MCLTIILLPSSCSSMLHCSCKFPYEVEAACMQVTITTLKGVSSAICSTEVLKITSRVLDLISSLRTCTISHWSGRLCALLTCMLLSRCNFLSDTHSLISQVLAISHSLFFHWSNFSSAWLGPEVHFGSFYLASVPTKRICLSPNHSAVWDYS